MLLCATVVLAACGSEPSADAPSDDDRRFVTDRPTTTATSIATASPIVALDSPTAASASSPQDLLEPRGAPDVVYLVIDGTLTAYDATTQAFAPIAVPDGVTLIDYTASPSGDRVGVLAWQDAGAFVQFFGADGEPLGDPVTLPTAAMAAPGATPEGTPAATPVTTPLATPMATPMASPLASPVPQPIPALNIEWIPQGEGVLVSGPGMLEDVSINGTTMPVSRTGAMGTVVNAVWSPMDLQVVIQTQQGDGHQSVFVLDSGHDEATELEVLHDTFGPSITNLQWLPSGLGLLMVAGNVQDGEVMNGQLWVYRFGESVPMLVATSGQGGPTATISHAVVSPDGQSVAYAVMVRDLDEWHLHSLWVKPLRGGPAVSVPVGNYSPITALMWSSEGLVWQQGDGTLSVVDSDLQPHPLGQAPAATPVASPLATPVASPLSTPVATPPGQATPRG